MGLLVALGLAFTALPARADLAAAEAETAPAEAELKEWFYAVDTAVIGPIGLTELRRLAGAAVQAATQVYVERNGWREAKDHPELADLFAVAAVPVQPTQPVVAPPPPPPPGPSQESLDAAAVSYFTGTWRAEFPSELESVDASNNLVKIKYRNVVDVTYQAGGKLVGIWSSYEMSGALSLALQMEGTYTLKATSQTNFILNARWRYPNSPFPPPQDPEKAYDSTTASLDMVDANTLKDAVNGNTLRRLR